MSQYIGSGIGRNVGKYDGIGISFGWIRIGISLAEAKYEETKGKKVPHDTLVNLPASRPIAEGWTN